MTLYLKYRPKNLDELDLGDVGENLKKIVLSKNIPHAFLFAGPKGTGKTSAARILSKIINCENLGKDAAPCDKCDECISITKGSNMDVVEMDAASHRGIDDVRILRDAVKLSPTGTGKKIYIIDEAHMLTTEASNALLKTLEEPPEHVVFILATTNPEKLIGTIRSRVTYIPFRRATDTEIVNSLKRVVKGEGWKVDDESLNIIAQISDGAFRDAIKTLEQLIAEGRDMSPDALAEHLLNTKSFDIENFTAMLIKKDVKGLLSDLEKMEQIAAPVDTFIEILLSKLKLLLLGTVGIGELPAGVSVSKKDLITLIELVLEASSKIKDSPIEELPLEIAIIKWCGGIKNIQTESAEEPEVEIPTPTVKIEEKMINEEKPVVSPAPVSDTVVPFPAPDPTMQVNDEAWRSILSLVKPINASIEALLRSSKPVAYDGKTLTLGVFYKFHKERLEDMSHRKVVEDVVASVLKSPTKVTCILVEPPIKKVMEEAKVEPVLTESADRDIIKVAEEIFSN